LERTSGRTYVVAVTVPVPEPTSSTRRGAGVYVSAAQRRPARSCAGPDRLDLRGLGNEPVAVVEQAGLCGDHVELPGEWHKRVTRRPGEVLALITPFLDGR
jgi:hypothetical protein